MKAEELFELKEEARKLYTWLRWSPLLILPTLYFLYGVFPIMLSLLISSLWHVWFLRKAFDTKVHLFVHWHARQALRLAFFQTAMLFVVWLMAQINGPVFFAILLLFIVWFVGTHNGEVQADKLDCKLMRQRKMAIELSELKKLEEDLKLDYPWWVHQLMYHTKEAARKEAALALGKLKEGHEEAFNALRDAMDRDNNYEVQAAARKALQSPIYLSWGVVDVQKPGESKSAQAEVALITTPEVAYQNGVKLLRETSNEANQKKALVEFVVAFREGDPVVRQQALVELEKLGEVEVF